MASNIRALRLLKTMDYLATKSTLTAFDNSSVLNKVKLESASNGTLKASFVVDETKCNFGGTLHGGYIEALVDVMSYYTAMTTPNGRVSYTTSMNVNYVKAVPVGERVTVETKTLKSGSSSLVETYLRNENGALLAKGTTSFLASEKKMQKFMKDVTEFDVYEN